MPSPVRNLQLPVPGQQRAFASTTLQNLPLPATQNVGNASLALPVPQQQVQLAQPQITLPLPQQQVQYEYVQQVPVQTVLPPPSATSVQAPKSPVVIQKADLFPNTPVEPPAGQSDEDLREYRLRQEHERREQMEESIMEYWTRYGAPGDWSQGPDLPKDFYTESYTAEVEAQRETAKALGKTKDGRLFHSAQNRGGLAKWTEVSMTKTMAMQMSSALPRGQVPVALQKATAVNKDWKEGPTDSKKYSLQALANAYRNQGVYFEVGAVGSQAYESEGYFVDLHVGAPLPSWVTNGCVVDESNVLLYPPNTSGAVPTQRTGGAIGFMPSAQEGFLLPGQEEVC